MQGVFLGYESDRGVIRGEDGKRYFFSKNDASLKPSDKCDFEADGEFAKSIFIMHDDKLSATISNIKDKVKSSVDSMGGKEGIEEKLAEGFKPKNKINFVSGFFGKIQNIFLALIAFSFILPWVNFLDIKLNGFQLMGEQFLLAIFLIVPIVSIYLNIIDSRKLARGLTIACAGFIVLDFLYYLVFETVAFFAIGIYIIVLAAVVLLTIEFRFVKEDLLKDKFTK